MSEVPTPRTRYAVYTRQSVARPSEFSSCDAQFEICRQFAEGEGGGWFEWVGIRFDDPGQSGSSLERPALARLRKMVADHLIERVYITRLDRLSRSVRDTCTLLHEFEQAGVELHLAQTPEMCLGADLRFIRHILASFAEFERQMIASRLADTRAAMKQQGKRLSGPAPFGYVVDARTKQLRVVPREAKSVQAIFRMAAEGALPTEIARHANAKGWRTKRYTSKRSGQVRGGGLWTARQILSLLHNPVYVGRFQDADGTRPGCHEPIVDSLLFDAAQERIRTRRTSTAQRHRAISFPLQGRMICPSCRRMLSPYMVTRRCQRTKIVYRYYRCRSTAGGRAPCKGIQFPAGEVETFVCRMLDEAETWRSVLGQSGMSTSRAPEMCMAWQAIGWRERTALLPKIVSRIVLDAQQGTITVDFDQAIAKLGSEADGRQ